MSDQWLYVMAGKYKQMKYFFACILFSEASGADILISPPYIYIYLGLGIVFVFAWAYVCTFSPTRLRGQGNLLSNILFCLPAVRSSDAQ